jgi:hypothetical protein
MVSILYVRYEMVTHILDITKLAYVLAMKEDVTLRLSKIFHNPINTHETYSDNRG